MRKLEEYIRPTQEQLFKMLCLDHAGNIIVEKKQWILVKGEAPIMLIAHMDTVHKEPVRDLCKSRGGKILMSPQGIGGDDRCGVYALNSVYNQAAVKPWLLFTCDEETGGGGAHDFADAYAAFKLPEELDNVKCLIEIDRKGKDDAVYYDCDNTEFENYITTKGFKTEWGTFSDISVIAPKMKVAAVNLSSGYYNAHTLYEYIDVPELEATIRRVLSIVEDACSAEFPVYEYIEAVYSYTYGGDWTYYGTKEWYAQYTKDIKSLADIPIGIRDEYEALLELHSRKELDSIRREMGDDFILRLFEAEYGGSYEDVFGDDEEEEQI